MTPGEYLDSIQDLTDGILNDCKGIRYFELLPFQRKDLTREELYEYCEQMREALEDIADIADCADEIDYTLTKIEI